MGSQVAARVEQLFAYGTLMCLDIMQTVSGLVPRHSAAAIRDYSRRAVRGEYYPALLPESGGHVEGVLYYQIPPSAWKRLDQFEGNMYVRQLVSVEVSDGSRIAAYTYVFRPQFRMRLTAQAWDYEAFLREGLAAFASQVSGRLS